VRRCILVIDVGGTNVKLLATGRRKRAKFESGPDMTPAAMVKAVKAIVADWNYEVITIGYPGPVENDRPAAEPHNLGPGWCRYDFARAFGRPVRMINDAAMQALGAYAGGKMLFLGLGTGLGSAMVVDGIVVPLELAHLPYRHGRTYEDYVGAAALERLGKQRWRHHVGVVVDLLRVGLQAGEVVLGGGNARLVRDLPRGVRCGRNADAFRGGYRLWQLNDRPRPWVRFSSRAPRAGEASPLRRKRR
jgi:polyphosphate glucokinase